MSVIYKFIRIFTGKLNDYFGYYMRDKLYQNIGVPVRDAAGNKIAHRWTGGDENGVLTDIIFKRNSRITK